ncbi:MAG: LytTR family DNA-binding domain-containing protein [Myxococcota bacterium]|nr:LytTR family DNA-binding domain-containing protein [Myxococcota bacterium]
MRLRTLIADDEQMARKRVRRLLEGRDDVEIVAEVASGEAALATLESIEVDLAILDVQMPGLSGLDVSSAAAELGVHVVFTTAHSEHAVQAFERGAVDYVMKPLDEARLALAIERVKARGVAEAAPTSSPSATTETAPFDRLALRVRGEVRLVRVEDVEHATLEGELVTVVAKGERLLTELSLQELERRLVGPSFWRVHRRALLNLAHVERLRPLPTGGYVAVTFAGDEVPVSRQEARKLRQRLGLPS